MFSTLDPALSEWKQFLKSTYDGDYEVARLGWLNRNSDPAETLQIFRCDRNQPGSANRSRLCDSSFEQTLAKALAATSLGERLKLLRTADDRIMSLQPVIPIFYMDRSTTCQGTQGALERRDEPRVRSPPTIGNGAASKLPARLKREESRRPSFEQRSSVLPVKEVFRDR